jgi:hypothetical protein
VEAHVENVGTNRGDSVRGLEQGISERLATCQHASLWLPGPDSGNYLHHGPGRLRHHHVSAIVCDLAVVW